MAEEKVEKFVALRDLYPNGGWARSNAQRDIVEVSAARAKELGWLDKGDPHIARLGTKAANDVLGVSAEENAEQPPDGGGNESDDDTSKGK